MFQGCGILAISWTFVLLFGPCARWFPRRVAEPHLNLTAGPGDRELSAAEVVVP